MISFLLAAAVAAYPDIPTRVGEARGHVAAVGGLPGTAVELRVGTITPIGDNDAAWTSRLVVLGAGGKPAWAGPAAFQGGPGGEDRLEAAGAGQVIVVMAQSDVRIPSHQFLRWTGKGLEAAKPAMFAERPARSGRFSPTTDPEPRGRYIAAFTRVLGAGRYEVRLDAGKPVVVRAAGDGFALVR